MNASALSCFASTRRPVTACRTGRRPKDRRAARDKSVTTAAASWRTKMPFRTTRKKLDSRLSWDAPTRSWPPPRANLSSFRRRRIITRRPRRLQLQQPPQQPPQPQLLNPLRPPLFLGGTQHPNRRPGLSRLPICAVEWGDSTISILMNWREQVPMVEPVDQAINAVAFRHAIV